MTCLLNQFARGPQQNPVSDKGQAGRILFVNRKAQHVKVFRMLKQLFAQAFALMSRVNKQRGQLIAQQEQKPLDAELVFKHIGLRCRDQHHASLLNASKPRR